MTRTYICLAQYVLTLNMLNCFKDYLKCIRISYQSWILFNRRRLNSQWSKPTCCLSYTDNTVHADALVTLGARASAGIVLTSKAKIFHLEHQKSWCKSDITPLLIHWSFVSFFFNPLRAIFFRENINIYLHFMSFLLLQYQYHGCWCPGDARSQGISNHDINIVKPS